MTDKDMHREHRDWSAEHATWLSDTARWQREHEQALRQLAALTQKLHEGDAQLKAHAQHIHAHEALSCDHEHTLTEPAPGRHGVLGRAMASRHVHESAAHENVAVEHAAIGARHAEAMKLIERLHDLLTKPNGG